MSLESCCSVFKLRRIKRAAAKDALTDTRHATKIFRTLFVLFYCSPITRKPAKSLLTVHQNFSRVIACRVSANTLQLRPRVTSQSLLPVVLFMYVNVADKFEKMSENTIIFKKWKADEVKIGWTCLVHNKLKTWDQ